MVDESKKLLKQTEDLSIQEASLFEQKQIIEDTVQNLFNTYLLEKMEQIERIEEHLETMISRQMDKIQTLQNSRPGFLARPSAKQAWSNNVMHAQARLNVLHDRLEDVKEIREGMGMNVPKVHELAMQKLRFENPNVAKEFDDIRTAVRVHRLYEKQRQEKQVQQQGLSQSLNQRLIP